MWKAGQRGVSQEVGLVRDSVEQGAVKGVIFGIFRRVSLSGVVGGGAVRVWLKGDKVNTEV